jgi:hypothetical protein
MVRWWTLSVLVAVAAVLFGFDGITAGPRVLVAIAFVASAALLLALLAEVVARRLSPR